MSLRTFLNSGRLLPVNDIAVDLGTANTLVYVKGEGIVLNEPSVVAVERGTHRIKGHRARGQAHARSHAGRHRGRPAAQGRRHRRCRHHRDDAAPLPARGHEQADLPDEAARDRGCAERDHGAGAAGGPSECAAAGAKEVFMVAEPMAAAIGVGLPVDTPTGNMVIDIGGGTTEIAVIALNGIVSDTSIRVGGDEIDAAIVSFLRKNYNLLIGEPTAEAIKIQIGSAFNAGDEREMEVKGRDLVSGIPKTVRVHSQEIRECIQEPIQQIVDAVRRALEITPPELASDIVDRGIVMTGGGALIRGLDLLLAHETDLPIHVDEEPLTCVVRGAGRILDEFERFRNVLQN
jgi:rod shape-determining protein MreB and related proteins